MTSESQSEDGTGHEYRALMINLVQRFSSNCLIQHRVHSECTRFEMVSLQQFLYPRFKEFLPRRCSGAPEKNFPNSSQYRWPITGRHRRHRRQTLANALSQPESLSRLSRGSFYKQKAADDTGAFLGEKLTVRVQVNATQIPYSLAQHGIYSQRKSD